MLAYKTFIQKRIWIRLCIFKFSSINDMISNDFNKDGNLDLLIAGNLYAAEVETTRNDASYGQLLFGDGLGDFSPVSFEESGICLPYDTKDLEAINLSQERGIIVANNNNLLKIIVAKEEAVIK